MREPKKTAELEATILNLLNKEPEVSIRSIAAAAGLSKDDATERKAIGRALISLEKKKQIAPKGSGRSRVYVRSDQVLASEILPTEVEIKRQEAFKGIELSIESRKLLAYVSQDLKKRKIVGYDQEFLRSYQPNKTFYLSQDRRSSLQEIGRVETIKRQAGTYARNILNRLLIDLSWNSSRLEGNTYSLLETKRLIELGEEAAGRDASEAQMILNHKAAIEYLVESAEEELITSQEIRSIHALLSDNLLGDPAASGRLRSLIVGIGGSTYLPIESPQKLSESFDLLVDKLNEISDPFEQSIFSIVHLSYLQAFEDVNKRTARLVANIPLVKANLKPLSFTDVEQNAYVSALLGVYEKTDISLISDLYVWAYNRSSQRYTAVQQSLGQPNPLKLKYRTNIGEIIRSVILEKVPGERIAHRIRNLIETQDIADGDRDAVLNLIETEIISLHDGNFARYRIRPSEFREWNDLQ